MNKLIICTVGTSISNQCPSQRDIIRKVTYWDDDAYILAHEIDEFLAKTKEVRKISAEFNSLDRIGIESGDKIVLLTSDNAPGRVCSEAIKKTLLSVYKLHEYQVEIKRIEGLQVTNSKRLREVGLRNFVKIVLGYLDNDDYRYNYDIILNPTGGFKGVLPFLTMLGMLYGKKTVYIFEFSDELIKLPPLPLSFDLKIFNRVRHAIKHIDENIAVSEQVYLSKILDYVPEERDLFMSFTEPFDDNTITLSPLAYCLIKIDSTQTYTLVTRKVIDKLNQIKGVPGLVIKRLIQNSANTLWRNTHSEHWRTTDLIVIKQPRTAERVAGFVKKGVFYVTHIFTDHSDYERTLVKYQKSDFEDIDFVEWKPNEYLGVDEGNRDELAAERDDLMIKNDELEKEIKILNTEKKSVKSEVKENLTELNSYADQIEKLKESLVVSKEKSNEVNNTIKKLRSELKRIKKSIVYRLFGRFI